MLPENIEIFTKSLFKKVWIDCDKEAIEKYYSKAITIYIDDKEFGYSVIQDRQSIVATFIDLHFDFHEFIPDLNTNMVVCKYTESYTQDNAKQITEFMIKCEFDSDAKIKNLWIINGAVDS